MSETIRPGDRVRVVFPPKHACVHHQRYVPTEGQIGVVNRLDYRFGDHPIIVVFNCLRHPPFSDPWVEGFGADELEMIPGTAMTRNPGDLEGPSGGRLRVLPRQLASLSYLHITVVGSPLPTASSCFGRKPAPSPPSV
jgi:hypothetical protein